MTENFSEQPTVYLIDGSAYIYRAYHAIAPLTTKSGLPTNAVFGFTNILLRVVRERQAKYLAVAFDARGKNFRHELYAAYKANRPPMPEDLVEQIPYIKKVVAGHNMLCLEQQGVEADDLIASSAVKLAAQGIEVVIVSGDKDLMQLVSDRVRMWDPMNDRWYDREAVKKKFNVTVEQLLEYFALVGDSSDNVPGIAGVGAKTAGKLIAEFGSLEKMYEEEGALGKGKMKDRLLAGREDAFLSRRLIALHTDCPVPVQLENYLLRQADTETLRQLYRELEFNRLLREELPAPALDTSAFSLIKSEKELEVLIARWEKASYLAIDLETSSLDPLVADLAGIAISTGKAGAYYLRSGCRGATGPKESAGFTTPSALQSGDAEARA